MKLKTSNLKHNRDNFEVKSFLTNGSNKVKPFSNGIHQHIQQGINSIGTKEPESLTAFFPMNIGTVPMMPFKLVINSTKFLLFTSTKNLIYTPTHPPKKKEKNKKQKPHGLS